MTYTALAILAMCGDDFSRIHKKPITKAMKLLQREDGSFSPVPGGSENDMRFVYCAACICYMLNDFSGMNVEKAVSYILSSQSYDRAIGQGPGQESHGGSTYCALAALHLMGQLHQLPHKEELVYWLTQRQISGFQGRINKDADSCYSFWIGASLVLLDSYSCVDFTAIRGFCLSCEQEVGGFSKIPNHYPDVLHTYMSLCGLSLGNEPGIEKIDCGLGFSQKAVDWINQIRN